MGSPNPPEGSEGISLLPRSWGWKTGSFSNQFTLICVSEGVSEPLTLQRLLRNHGRGRSERGDLIAPPTAPRESNATASQGCWPIE